MGVWEKVVEFVDSDVGKALAAYGAVLDVASLVQLTFIVSKWTRGSQSVSVECGRCGSEDSEEIWELDGVYCCDLCMDDVDI